LLAPVGLAAAGQGLTGERDASWPARWLPRAGYVRGVEMVKPSASKPGREVPWDVLGGPDPRSAEDVLGGPDHAGREDELAPDGAWHEDELGGPGLAEEQDVLGGPDQDGREDELGGPAEDWHEDVLTEHDS
jgi:hypothetical protein